MKIEQIYTGCLAQGAYYIESNGEVAIIDPLREVNSYIEKAQANNATIKYIFETHFHADFVSGHLTLADKTGAKIVYGPTAQTKFDAVIAEDFQEFQLGEVTIVALHTPGHTLESTTYLLKDENGKNHAVFSGDTLFLGDVGRPDLAQKAANMTMEDLAGMSYDSLREKIMPLEDHVIVYPGHGAGSACGKNMMKETIDTLGNQKKMNYALREDMTRSEFIKEVTEGLQEPPKYFPLNVKMNKEGYQNIEDVIAKSNKALNPEEFEALAENSDALILDVRHQNDFVKGFIPRSIFIGLKGGFAPWVGALIADVNQPILLVVNKGEEEEAITRLSRVGFDNVLGYLDNGFESWQTSGREVDTMTSISSEEFSNRYASENIPVYDVRKEGEFLSAHVKDANLTSLDVINNYLKEFPSDNDFYIHCAGGYRSVIAGSILKSRGIHNLINVEGGMSHIRNTAIPLVENACSSMLK